MLRVMQIKPVERLVDSKFETENQPSLSTHTTRSLRSQKDSSVSDRLHT